MESVKRAPDYILVGEFTADALLSSLKKGDGIVCNGYEYLNIQILPFDSASVDIEIGYWSDNVKEVGGDIVGGFVTDLDNTKKTAITVASEFSISARGRNVGLGVEVSTGSVQVLVSAFNLVAPD